MNTHVAYTIIIDDSHLAVAGNSVTVSHNNNNKNKKSLNYTQG